MRATSFGGIAESYDRHRPAPPAQAVAWLLPRLGARRALDLATGTGALAWRLAPLVEEVLAFDLDPRMLTFAHRRVPDAPLAAARAEALPLRDASVDLVGVSSAWHWVDPERALPEMARVLRPGGVLGLLWGGPDRAVPWVRELLAGGHHGDDPGPPAEGRRRWHDTPVPRPDVALGPADERTFTATVPYATADLPGLAGSYSSVITLPADEQLAEGERIRAMLGSHPELAGRARVDLPLTCRAIRLERLA